MKSKSIVSITVITALLLLGNVAVSQEHGNEQGEPHESRRPFQ